MSKHVGSSKFTLCHCRNFGYPSNWRDHDLWTHKDDDSGVGPVPPSCIHCGGWPAWWDRDCSECKTEFYYFFLHTQQRGYPLELCWLCVQSSLGDPRPWITYDRILRPHPDTLPKRRSAAELLEAIRNL